jgi:hypothetical protein
VKEEFYAVAYWTTFYESLDPLQRDLDKYLGFYNRERAHQGYRPHARPHTLPGALGWPGSDAENGGETGGGLA